MYAALAAPTLSRTNQYTIAMASQQSTGRQETLQEIAGILESAVFNITDIMVCLVI